MYISTTRSVVWHPGHLQLLHWIQMHRLEPVVYKLINDRIAIFNFFYYSNLWYGIGQPE